MSTEKTSGKRDEATCCSGSEGRRMFEMMSACCTGQGGSFDCSTMMKGMMETIKSQGCPGQGIKDAGPDRRKK